ncbi:MAG: non-ribosomal peptide synthetase component F, partial [Cyclobacteriaceae bacterium]
MDKKVLHTLIDNYSITKPEVISVNDRGVEWTYAELLRYSNRIGNCLVSLGLSISSPVGVYMESSFHYICSILGVNKAGGVFMPLEPNYPQKRLDYLLTKVSPSAIVVSESSYSEFIDKMSSMEFGASLKHVIVVSNKDLSIQTGAYTSTTVDLIPFENNDEAVSVEVNGDDSNYLLYTSGSTGFPKVIEGCHKSLSHFIHWEVSEFSKEGGLRVSQLVPISFDVSLRDIYVPLLSGGTLCIPDSEIKLSPRELIDWLGEQKIDLIHTVPSLFRLITRELKQHAQLLSSIQSLQYILLSGEALYGRDVESFQEVMGKDITLVNLYGPTE